MKKLLLSILAVTASWASASTVSLSSNAAGPSAYNNANTAPVPNGGLIRIGYFTDPANTDTFVEFGTSTLKNGGLGAGARSSKVNGSVVDTGGEADDAAFNNKDIYVWIYSGATAANSAESGIFHAVGQTFPVDDPAGVGDAVTVLATNLTQYLTPKGGSGGRADFSAAANDTQGNGRLILATFIPEPSSMGLLALAGLALARRRR